MKILLLMVSIGMSSCTAEYLPHRPLSEIDIQGHMDYAPRRQCPAVYDAPQGELRFCL